MSSTNTVAPGTSPTSIPSTQPTSSSPLAPSDAPKPSPTSYSSSTPIPDALRSGMTSPPIDPSQLNQSPAPIPIPAHSSSSPDPSGTVSPSLRSPENPLDSAYLDTGVPLEPSSHPTVAETGPMSSPGKSTGPGPKSGQLERKERKVGEGIIKLGSFGGEGLVAKPPAGLRMGDEEAVE